MLKSQNQSQYDPIGVVAAASEYLDLHLSKRKPLNIKTETNRDTITNNIIEVNVNILSIHVTKIRPKYLTCHETQVLSYFSASNVWDSTTVKSIDLSRVGGGERGAEGGSDRFLCGHLHLLKATYVSEDL